MPSFSEVIEQRGLSAASEFEDIAQAAIEVHYLTPYRSMPDNRPHKINRHFHGGVHVARSTLNAEMLVALYKKYAPKFAVGPSGGALTEEDLKLLKLAVIYHDSANTSEIKGDGEEHATNFLHDMQLLGYSEERLLSFARAIINKDANAPKNFLQKIIHDADCLDIIRVCGDKFDQQRLDILRDLHDKPGFETELRQIIATHHETIRLIEGNETKSSLHKECEFSLNCYKAVRAAMVNMLLSHALVEGAKRGKFVNLSAINSGSIDILELYNRSDDAFVQRISSSSSSVINNPAEDEVLTTFREQGYLARVLRGTEIDRELETLRTNAGSLARAGIASADELREYLVRQSGQSEVYTPEGFRWRPCSYCTAGVPITLFTAGVGVLIDPRIEAVYSHFYKINVISARAAYGGFVYDEKTGPKKDKGSVAGIREKVLEQNRRRIGVEEDPNSHYFGSQSLAHSEVLGSYQPRSVAGIIVNAHDRQTIKDALLLRAKLGTPARKFYSYSPENGLTPLSDSSLISMLRKSELEGMVDSIKEQLECPTAISLNENFDVSREWSSHFEHFAFFKKYQLVISRNISPMAYEKIKQILSSVRATPYEDAIDEREPIDVHIRDNEDGIYFDLKFNSMYEKATTSELCKYESRIAEILVEISVALESDITLEEMKENARLIEPLFALTNIPDIEKLPRGVEISAANPLQFKFTHPLAPDVKCTAWVKNGEPCIDIIRPSHKPISIKTNMLPKIAKFYYQQQANKLQDLFANPAIANFLRDKGIINIQFNMLSGGKVALGVGFDVTLGTNIEDAKSVVMSLFLIAKPEKVKTASFDAPHTRECVLSIRDVQRLDLFVARVESFIISKTPPGHEQVDDQKIISRFLKEINEISGGSDQRHYWSGKNDEAVEIGIITYFANKDNTRRGLLDLITPNITRAALERLGLPNFNSRDLKDDEIRDAIKAKIVEESRQEWGSRL